MHPFRRPGSIPLALAQEAYNDARAQLLIAEEAYARTLLALRSAQADAEATPLAPHERHFLCGHAGMVRTEEGGDQVLSLCPACRARQAASASPFTEERLLLLREPRPNDPDVQPPR